MKINNTLVRVKDTTTGVYGWVKLEDIFQEFFKTIIEMK